MQESFHPHHGNESATINDILDVKKSYNLQSRVANLFLFATIKGKESETEGRHHLWQFFPDNPSLWISENHKEIETLSKQDPKDIHSDIIDLNAELYDLGLYDFPLVVEAAKIKKLKPYHDEPRQAYVAAIILTIQAHEEAVKALAVDDPVASLGRIVMQHPGDNNPNSNSAA